MKTKRKYSDDEWRMQAHIFEWACKNEYRYPELALLSGSLNGVRLTIGQAIKAKKAGMLKGWPDIQLPVARDRFIGLFIELKTDKGYPSKEQKTLIQALVNEGHFACVCRGFDAAIKIIERYLNCELV